MLLETLGKENEKHPPFFGVMRVVAFGKSIKKIAVRCYFDDYGEV